MTPHSEAYENLGEVRVWVQDLHPVWEKKRGTKEVTLPHDRIWAQFKVHIDMPRELVWDYLIQPKYRNSLVGSDRMKIANRSNGRIAPGSVYQCYHGDKLVPQTILEWQPFERMIVKELFTLFPNTGGISEYRLDSKERGTKLTKSIGRPTGPFFERAMLHLLMPVFKRFLPQALENFKRQIESNYRKRSQSLGESIEFSDE